MINEIRIIRNTEASGKWYLTALIKFYTNAEKREVFVYYDDILEYGIFKAAHLIAKEKLNIGNRRRAFDFADLIQKVYIKHKDKFKADKNLAVYTANLHTRI